MTPIDADRARLVRQVAGHLREEQRVEAARLVLDFSGLPVPKNFASEAAIMEPLWALLQWCLSNDYYEEAAFLLWGPRLFNAKPRSTQMIWKAIRDSSQVLLIGASSMSKTFSAGVYFFLDWLRDPEYTSIKVVGPTEPHLSDNLFSHLVSLHRSSAIPLPGEIGDLFIGMDLRQRRSSIIGVVMPRGQAKAGKLQGVKRFPRKVPHPKFGRLSRLRILLDEIEKIPLGVWSDLDNVLSNIGESGGEEGLKIVGAYNPSDLTLPVAQRAEPPSGWDSFDLETDETWTSRRGWSVVRLDAHKCENVVRGTEIFPGLQTKQGLEALARSAGGTDSPAYYTFGRGAYPPRGTNYGIIPPTLLSAAKGRFVWYDTPRSAAGIDLALEGGDMPTVALGLWGISTGVKIPPSTHFPNGREIAFQQPRLALQLDRIFTLEPGDTISIARQIRSMAVNLRLSAEWIMLDSTGNGAGVRDLVKDIWSPEIRGVNYTESATRKKIMQEDADVPYDIYDRLYTELWFATRKWIEFGVLRIAPEVESEDLFTQLTSRLYKQQGKKAQIESKRNYSLRGFKSPDKADALTLLVHAVRVASEVSPSMLGPTTEEADSFFGDDGSIYDTIIGPTDRYRDLDDDTNPVEEGFGAHEDDLD